MEKIDWYAGVCPNNPKVRRTKLNSINQLIKFNNIDGIWLDFIRFPCHWEEVRNSNIIEYCFCKICINKFKREVGGKPEGNKWTEWKCRQIANFVSDINHLIQKNGKNIKLGMFAIPWQKHEFGGAIKNIIGQDFKQLTKYIDIFTPMVYHKFCGRSISWISETIKYFSRMTHAPILPIIQSENRPENISKKEFLREMEVAQKNPSDGYIIFFLEDLLKDSNKIELLQSQNLV